MKITIIECMASNPYALFLEISIKQLSGESNNMQLGRIDFPKGRQVEGMVLCLVKKGGNSGIILLLIDFNNRRLIHGTSSKFF